MAIFVSFRWDSSILTATRTADAPAVSKGKFHETKNDVFCLQRSVLNPEIFKVKKLIISTNKKTDEICSQMTKYYIKHINRDREI